jgi:hypothetical protein
MTIPQTPAQGPRGPRPWQVLLVVGAIELVAVLGWATAPSTRSTGASISESDVVGTYACRVGTISLGRDGTGYVGFGEFGGGQISWEYKGDTVHVQGRSGPRYSLLVGKSGGDTYVELSGSTCWKS